MSYTPTVWSNGDSITAEKFNKLENGVAARNGIFWVTENENQELDKNWNEIVGAVAAGMLPVIKADGGFIVIQSAEVNSNDQYPYIVMSESETDAHSSASPTGILAYHEPVIE